MPHTDQKIKIFTLSTCIHCKRTKAYLQDCQVPFEFVDVDLLQGEERKSIMEEVARHNPRLTFPTVLIGDQVIIGFDQEKLNEILKR
ncbi:MAG: glutaredoxin family protein [candidate division NC10 bacterium]|nr:glutaredoxin family protein [candidate division NC10 bacterium]